MQTLPLLIRLARQRADERRMALSQAEQQRRAAERRLHAQAAQARAEALGAAGDPAAMAAWSCWSRQADRESSQLREAVSVAAGREEELLLALAENFAEAKRLELAWDARQKLQARLALRRVEQRMEEAELRRTRSGP